MFALGKFSSLYLLPCYIKWDLARNDVVISSLFLTKFNLVQPNTAKPPVQDNSFVTDVNNRTSYCHDEIVYAQAMTKYCRSLKGTLKNL